MKVQHLISSFIDDLNEKDNIEILEFVLKKSIDSDQEFKDYLINKGVLTYRNDNPVFDISLLLQKFKGYVSEIQESMDTIMEEIDQQNQSFDSVNKTNIH
jgi:hypothetical protein